LSPLVCWQVEQRGGKIVVRARRHSAEKTGSVNERIVIVGGGAPLSAAEMLRRRGFAGSIAISAMTTAPVDRPNLSKDYLAGSAPRIGCRCVAATGTLRTKSTSS
jgi:hypothetical protein